MKFKLVIIGLFILSWNLYAQDENARYCQFSNLRISPDSTALIFNIDYFEEGERFSDAAVFLKKEFETGKMTCLNPHPLRFAVSGNGKYLIFSALYGIFVQELTDSARCTQLKFFNPADDVYLRDIGFFAADSGIFWITENYAGQMLERKFLSLKPDTTNENTPKFLEVPVPKQWKKSSLPVADPNSGRKSEFRLKKPKLRYSINRRTGAEFDLSDIVFQEKGGTKKTVLSKIRPWLISIDPTQRWILFSGWRKSTGENSWLHLAGTDSLRKIGTSAFKFVTWIDSSRFIGLNGNGLFGYATDSLDAQPIKPECCRDLLAVADSDATNTEIGKVIVGGQVFKIENSPGLFKRSRIRVTHQISGETSIFVPEMSNLKKKW